MTRQIEGQFAQAFEFAKSYNPPSNSYNQKAHAKAQRHKECRTGHVDYCASLRLCVSFLAVLQGETV
jgi:hypothetical protein